MVHAAGEEPVEELVAAAQVTRDQLRRYQREGLIPRPRQVGLGRGRGTRVLYPAGSTKQLLALRALLKIPYSFAVAMWQLWWEGFDVGEAQFRELLVSELDVLCGALQETEHLSNQELASKSADVIHLPDEAQTKLFEYLEPAFRAIRLLVQGGGLRKALDDTSTDGLRTAREELRNLYGLVDLVLNAIAAGLGRGPIYDLVEAFVTRFKNFPIPSHIDFFLIWLFLRRNGNAQQLYEQFLPMMQVFNGAVQRDPSIEGIEMPNYDEDQTQRT